MEAQYTISKPEGITSYHYQVGETALADHEGFQYCNYTYRYTWVAINDNLLEEFYLSEISKMELYEHSLKVWKGKERYSFAIKELQHVKSEFSYYILPMIVGGVVTPLGGLALFNHYLNSWTSMIMFVAGLLLFYYGMKGAEQVTVIGQQYQVHFFVDEGTEQLKSFLGKVRKQILLKKEY